MPIPLEDDYEDIIAKAQRGHQLTDSQLEALCGIPRAKIREQRRGHFDPDTAGALAKELHLKAEALIQIARKEWHPQISAPEPLQVFNSHYPIPSYPEMTVNAYLLDIIDSEATILFDCGADATPILAHLKKENRDLEAIFITHTHGDHIKALPEIRSAFPNAKIYQAPKGNPIPGSHLIKGQESISIHSHQITALHTPGHSQDGCSYKVCSAKTETPNMLFTGDALFAGSIGGVPSNLKAVIAHIKTQLFSESDSTLICPGHGPLSRIGLERRHNPFF